MALPCRRQVPLHCFHDLGGLSGLGVVDGARGDGEGRVLAEEVTERPYEVDEVVVREDPGPEIRDGNGAGGVDEGMARLDGRARREREEHGRRQVGVGLEEPDGDRETGGGGRCEGDGALGAEEGGATAVVVSEVAGGGSEGGERVGQGCEMLVDRPPGFLSVWKRSRSAVGERGRQVLVHRRGRRRPRKSRHELRSGKQWQPTRKHIYRKRRIS